MKRKYTPLLVMAAISAAVTQLRAADLYWSGSGTWDTSTPNWGFLPTGPYTTSIWSNSNPDSANFEGSDNAAYTVTVSGAISIQNLNFNTTGTNGSRYTISGGSLNFASGGTISNSDNRYNQTITSTITGSPSVSIIDRGAGNTYEGLKFEPSVGNTQTLGAVLMPNNTGSSDKAGIYLGGSTTGNSATSIAYAGGDQYGTVYKQGSGTWTTGNITTGTLRISQGNLVVNGNVTTLYQGVIMSGSGMLSGNATVFKNDRRSANEFVSGTGIAPGNSVGTVTFDWGTAGSPAAAQWTTAFRTGSIYEWEVGAANATDLVHVVDGRLILEGFTLKILDAGGTPDAADQLPVFTYGTLDSKTLALGSVNFDTSALGAGWSYDNLALTDNNAGSIFLTGLSFSPIPEPSSALLAGLGALLLLRRRRQ